jgi:uncharacterized membrane protein required for colicin V production
MASSKVCVICGEDCSTRPRTKDPRGHYYCLSCYEQARRKLEQNQAVNTQPPAVEAEEESVLSDLLDGVLNQTTAAVAPPPPLPAAAPRTPERPKTPTGWVGFFLSPWGIGLCLLVTMLAAVTVFGDTVSILFFLFIALFVVNGYWIGAAKIGALLGGLIAGAMFAVPVGKGLEGLCASIFNTTGTTNRLLSIAISALVSVVLVTGILQVIIGRWQKRAPKWKRYDRVVGSGLGLLEGALLGMLLIWAVLSLEPIAATSLAQTESPDGANHSNPISRQVVALAQTARSSTVGRIADATNPFKEMRLITLLSKGLIVISDPGAQQAFVSHPAIKAIQKRPSVQQAMQMLNDDPEISKHLDSQSTGVNLRAILASPTLLAIFDQTDIVADLSPLADEIERAINEAMEYRSEQ